MHAEIHGSETYWDDSDAGEKMPPFYVAAFFAIAFAIAFAINALIRSD